MNIITSCVHHNKQAMAGFVRNDYDHALNHLIHGLKLARQLTAKLGAASQSRSTLVPKMVAAPSASHLPAHPPSQSQQQQHQEQHEEGRQQAQHQQEQRPLPRLPSQHITDHPLDECVDLEISFDPTPQDCRGEVHSADDDKHEAHALLQNDHMLHHRQQQQSGLQGPSDDAFCSSLLSVSIGSRPSTSQPHNDVADKQRQSPNLIRYSISNAVHLLSFVTIFNLSIVYHMKAVQHAQRCDRIDSNSKHPAAADKFVRKAMMLYQNTVSLWERQANEIHASPIFVIMVNINMAHLVRLVHGGDCVPASMVHLQQALAYFVELDGATPSHTSKALEFIFAFLLTSLSGTKAAAPAA